MYILKSLHNICFHKSRNVHVVRVKCIIPIYIQRLNFFINQFLFLGLFPWYFSKLMSINKFSIMPAIPMFNFSIILNFTR